MELKEYFDDIPDLEDRGFLIELSHPRMGRLRLPGNRVRMRDTELPVWRLGPFLGQDNRGVLTQLLGLDEAAIASLMESGFIC